MRKNGIAACVAILTFGWASEGHALEVWPAPKLASIQPDGSASIDVVVINDGMEPVHSTVVSIDLATGVTVLAGTDKRVRGVNNALSLGDILPGDSRSVRVVARPAADGTVITQLRVFGVTSGLRVERTSSGARAELISASDAASLDPTVEANARDPEILAEVARLGGDRDRILDRVRSIRFEAYRGSLRGARGVHWSRAGNAVDTASYGIALLRAAGLRAQFGFVQLTPEDAALLLEQMRFADTGMAPIVDQEATLEALRHPDTLAQGDTDLEELFRFVLPTDPNALRDLVFPKASHDPVLIEATRRHAMIVLDGGQVMDPFASAWPSPKSPTSVASVIDESERHFVTFRVESEVMSPSFDAASLGSLPRVENLVASWPSARLVGRPVQLVHQVRHEVSAGIFTVYDNVYTPELSVAGEEPQVGTAYQEVISSFARSSQILSGLWIRVTTKSPGLPDRTHTIPLVDRLGALVRGEGFGPDAGMSQVLDLTLDGTPVLSPADAAIVDVAPSWLGSIQLAGSTGRTVAAARRMSVSVPHIRELERRQAAGLPLSGVDRAEVEGFEGQIRATNLALAEDVATNYRAMADAWTQSLSEHLLVRAYPDHPRLTCVRAFTRIQGPAPLVDVVDDDVLVTGDGRAPLSNHRSFRGARGYFLSSLEGHAVKKYSPNAQVISFDEVAVAAEAQGIPFALFHPFDETHVYRAGYDARVTGRILETMAAGNSVFAPLRPVAFGSQSVVLWLEIETRTGNIIARDANGHHTSFQEYLGLNSVLTEGEGIALGLLVGFADGTLTAMATVIESEVQKVAVTWPSPLDIGKAVGQCFVQIVSESAALTALESATASVLSGSASTTPFAEMLSVILTAVGQGLGTYFLAPKAENVYAFTTSFVAATCVGGLIASYFMAAAIQGIHLAVDPMIPTANRGAYVAPRLPGPEVLLSGIATPTPVPAQLVFSDAVRATGDLSLSASGHFDATGQLIWHVESTIPSPAGDIDGPVDLTLKGFIFDGAATLEYTGDLASSGSDIRTVGTERGELDLHGHFMAFVIQDDGERVVEYDGAVRIELRTSHIRVDGDVQGTGKGFAHEDRITSAGDLIISAPSLAPLAVEVRPTRHVELTSLAPMTLRRGERQTLSLDLVGSDPGILTTTLEPSTGLFVDRPDVSGTNDVILRAAPDAPLGVHELIVSVRQNDVFDARGGLRVPVNLIAGSGLEMTLTHVPMFAEPSEGVAAPLVWMARLTNNTEASGDVALTFQASPGYGVRAGAERVHLGVGEETQVFVALSASPLPSTNSPVELVVQASLGAQTVEARDARNLPAVVGASLAVSEPRLHLLPGETQTATLTITGLGNGPDTLHLRSAAASPIHVTGLPASVQVGPGVQLHIPLTIGVAAGSVDGVAYSANIIAARGDLDVAAALLDVEVVSTLNARVQAVRETATRLEERELASASSSLLEILPKLQYACSSRHVEAFAQNLRVAAAAIRDPVLRGGRLRLQEEADRLTSSRYDCRAVDLDRALSILEGVADQLRTRATSDFSVVLTPSASPAVPGQVVPFTLALLGLHGPVELDLRLEGLTGSITDHVQVPVAGVQVPFTVVAEEGAQTFRVHASLTAHPDIERIVAGVVAGGAEAVEIVRFDSDTRFAIPGSKLSAFVELSNLLGIAQDLEATVKLRREDGTLVYTSVEPTRLHVPLYGTTQRYTLDWVPTFGELEGNYTLELELGRQGAPVPGGTAETILTLGAPIDVTRPTTPPVLAPSPISQGLVTTHIEVVRRAYTPLPGLGRATSILRLDADAEGPARPTYGPDGTLYFASFGSQRVAGNGFIPNDEIKRVSSQGVVDVVGHVASTPTVVTWGPDGYLYAASAGAVDRIERMDPVTGLSSTYFDWGTTPSPIDGLNVVGLAFGSDGTLYATDLWDGVFFGIPDPGRRVYSILPDGNGDGVSDGLEVLVEGLSSPQDMVFDARTQSLFVIDTDRRRVVSVDTRAPAPRELIPLITDGSITGLALTPSGHLLVADDESATIRAFDTDVSTGVTRLLDRAGAVAGSEGLPLDEGVALVSGVPGLIGLAVSPGGESIAGAVFDSDEVIVAALAAPMSDPQVTLATTHAPTRGLVTGSVTPALGVLGPGPGPAIEYTQVPMSGETFVVSLTQDLGVWAPAPLLARTSVVLASETRIQAESGTEVFELSPGALILPVRRMLEADRDTVNINRGDRERIHLTLTNLGSEGESIHLAPAFRPEDVRGYFDGDRSEFDVFVPPGGSSLVMWDLEAAPDARVDSYEVGLDATSGHGTERVVIRGRVFGTPIRAVSDGDDIVEVVAGEPLPIRIEFCRDPSDTRPWYTWYPVGLPPGVSFSGAFGAFDFRGQLCNYADATVYSRPDQAAGRFAFQIFASQIVPGRATSAAPVGAATLIVRRHEPLEIWMEPRHQRAPLDSDPFVYAVVENRGHIPRNVRIESLSDGRLNPRFNPGPYVVGPGQKQRVPIQVHVNNFYAAVQQHQMAAVDVDHPETRAISDVALIEVASTGVLLGFEEPGPGFVPTIRRTTTDGSVAVRVLVQHHVLEPMVDSVELEVSGPLSTFVSETTRHVDMSNVGGCCGVWDLSLAGLSGLAPGPWPLVIRGVSSRDPSVPFEATAWITVDAGDVVAFFAEDPVYARTGDRGRADLRLINRDFGRSVSSSVELVSCDPSFRPHLTEGQVLLGPGREVGIGLEFTAPTQVGAATCSVRVTPDGADPIEVSVVLQSTVDAPPAAPRITTPASGEVVGRHVHVAASRVFDPEFEAVQYHFEVSKAGTPVASQVMVEPTADFGPLGSGTHEVTVWASAGLSRSAASPPVTFVVDPTLENRPPEAPVFQRPLSGAEIEAGSLMVEVDSPADPDGDPVTVYIVAASDAAMSQVIGTATLLPGEARRTTVGEAMPDQTVYLEAVADDGFGGTRAARISVHVRPAVINRPPSAPVLVAPGPQSEVVRGSVLFSFERGLDPEGSAVLHTIVVERRANGGPWMEIIRESADDIDPSGFGAKSLGVTVTGAHRWRVAAADAEGAIAVSEDVEFDVISEPDGGLMADSGSALDGGSEVADAGFLPDAHTPEERVGNDNCGCRSSASASNDSTELWLALLVFLSTRGRRRIRSRESTCSNRFPEE